MKDVAIRVENVSKVYSLGVIGSGTLRGDIESWWAKKRGREDPNALVGEQKQIQNGAFYALDGVSFEAKQGEALGIIGKNGAGKSTLLKLITQITAPSVGKIFLDGRVSSMLEVGTGFHPEMTGRENIYMNGAILGMSRAEIAEKIDDIIEFSECEKFIDTPVKRYSSGMYVKLAFSVAAHLNSEIIIMDEVLAVGDAAFQNKCLAHMKNISQNENRTVLYVSHNMSTIRRLCDRCLVLDKGKLVYDGDVERAIAVYLGGDYGISTDTRVLVPNSDEAKNAGVWVNSVCFPNKEINTFSHSEPLTVELDLEISRLFNEKLQIRSIVRYVDETVTACSVSQPFEVGCGKEKVRLLLDISLLASGSYYLLFDIFYEQSGVLQDYQNLYTVIERVPFIIEPKKEGMVWKHMYWGNVMLPESQVIKE